MLVWWNRFTGLSDAAFLMYGQQVLAGRVPYRDFYLPFPPLTVVKTAALIKVFGSLLIVPRLLAMLERSCLSAALFCWLASAFRLRDALLGTVVAMIVFCGDLADQLSSYHHDSVFLSVAAGICATLLLRKSTSRRRLAALCCGLFCGLALLTKQTTGAGIGATLFAVIVLSYEPEGKAPSRASVAALFVAGWAIPIAAVGGWLFHAGALPVAVQTVFGKGTASKGPLLHVLARPIRDPLVLGVYREAWLAALFLLVGAWLLLRDAGAKARFSPVLSKALALACFGIATYELFRDSFLVSGYFLWIYLGLLVGFAVSAHTLLKRLAGPLDDSAKRIWVFAATSFAVAYMLSLSWAAYQPMAVPAIAFVICFLLAHTDKTRFRSSLRLFITIAGLTLAVVAVVIKLAMPYDWVGWREPPVWHATGVPHLPELRGMRLSPTTIDTVEMATHAIQGACPTGGLLFAYPYSPLLYALSHRAPATYSYLPWYDVTPDDVAEQDARLLLSQPPCAIAYLELPSQDNERFELLYRGRQASGQRALVRAIETLAKSYRILFVREFPGGTKLTVFGARTPPAVQ